MLGRLQSGFFGVLGLAADASAEAYSQAARMAWLKEPTSPDDVLPVVGAERRMPRYPIETPAIYRDRLWRAWEAYPFGGSTTAIERQLEAAGFPGRVRVSSIGRPWPEFWVLFDEDVHPITSPGKPWGGSFVWGDGTLWGPQGIAPEGLRSLVALVDKWKHVQWVRRYLVFQISGWSWGTGHAWGEDDLVWGGVNAQVGVI